MLSILFVFGLNALRIMRGNILRVPEWDFLLYWVYGRAAALGLNPYQPENLRQLALPFNPSPELLAELYFFQSPPALFIFAWLGWFEIHQSYLLWYGVHSLILGLDIFLLWKIFYQRSSLWALMFVACLMLLLPGTLSTIAFGQLNFLVLLMLLLYWQQRERWQGGIWLALGIVAKPILVFVILYPLLKRQWSIIVSMMATGVVLSLATVIIFGPTMFLDYFFFNPILNQMPGALYRETINQSLLATILRLVPTNFSEASPLMHPLYIILSAILALISLWLVVKLPVASADWAIALLVSFALLVFPKTLAHYSVFLIVPILVIWRQRQAFNLKVLVVIVFLTLIYAFTAVRASVFLAFLLTWILSVRAAYLCSTGKDRPLAEVAAVAKP